MRIETLAKRTKPLTKAQQTTIAKIVGGIELGNRSGNADNPMRKIGDEIRRAIAEVIVTGEAVEVTSTARKLVTGESDKSNEYHLVWSRTRTTEKHLGKVFRVVNFVAIHDETKTTITGETKTTGYFKGRVFIAPMK